MASDQWSVLVVGALSRACSFAAALETKLAAKYRCMSGPHSYGAKAQRADLGQESPSYGKRKRAKQQG